MRKKRHLPSVSAAERSQMLSQSSLKFSSQRLWFTSNCVVIATAVTDWAISVSLWSLINATVGSADMHASCFFSPHPVVELLTMLGLLNAFRFSHTNPKNCICLRAYDLQTRKPLNVRMLSRWSSRTEQSEVSKLQKPLTTQMSIGFVLWWEPDCGLLRLYKQEVLSLLPEHSHFHSPRFVSFRSQPSEMRR